MPETSARCVVGERDAYFREYRRTHPPAKPKDPDYWKKYRAKNPDYAAREQARQAKRVKRPDPADRERERRGGADYDKKLERNRRWREKHRDELNAHRRATWVPREPAIPAAPIPEYEIEELTAQAIDIAHGFGQHTHDNMDSGQRDIIQEVVLALLEGRDPLAAFKKERGAYWHRLYYMYSISGDPGWSAGPLIA